MGIHDRPYMQDEQGGGGGGWRGVTVGLPRPARAVKYLLIINLAAFVVQLLLYIAKIQVSPYLGVTLLGWWQVWRYLTFQFLHDPTSIWHVALNMLGLYMFGSPLERRWGSKRFLEFYLSCGLVAGLAYVVAGAVLGSEAWVPLIGASGGVYGILLACAVLFPNFRIILFLFPVPIRLGAIIIFGGMILYLLVSVREGIYSGGFWSHVAHLGGAVMGALWVWVIPRMQAAHKQSMQKAKRGAWQRKMERQRREEAEIDRILQKVHEQGIGSLSAKEKRTLQDATRRQQEEDSKLNRL